MRAPWRLLPVRSPHLIRSRFVPVQASPWSLSFIRRLGFWVLNRVRCCETAVQQGSSLAPSQTRIPKSYLWLLDYSTGLDKAEYIRKIEIKIICVSGHLRWPWFDKDITSSTSKHVSASSRSPTLLLPPSMFHFQLLIKSNSSHSSLCFSPWISSDAINRPWTTFVPWPRKSRRPPSYCKPRHRRRGL